MKRLFITEKNTVAKAVAKELGATVNGSGYFETPDGHTRVSWASGHLCEIFAKEQDVPWEADYLPILPDVFYLKAVAALDKKTGKKVTDPNAVARLKALAGLMNDWSDEVVNGCDAGREGELIFRRIYHYTKCKKTMLRFWASSMSPAGIRRALDDLRPGDEFFNLYIAAKLRAEADWLVGINATRAFTIACGKKRLCPLGRVMTPTLALVCKRYDENRNFVPEPFWSIQSLATKDGIQFTMKGAERYKKGEDAEDAKRTIDSLGCAIVTKAEKSRKEEKAPLLFNLTEVQKVANSKYGFSAKHVEDIIEVLYLKGMVSYPRTDSKCITPGDFEEIPGLIKLLYNHPRFGDCAKGLDLAHLNKACVNEMKVTDHGALTIKETPANGLSNEEQKIYDLIAMRMLEAFSPSCFCNVTKAEFASGSINLTATGRQIIVPGWRSVAMSSPDKLAAAQDHDGGGENEDTDENAVLPSFTEGERIPVQKTDVIQGETRPKPILTETSLLALMENAGKETEDEVARKALKNAGGIGTSATRAEIIEKLIKTQQIVRDNKKLLPTPFGYSIYRALKDMKITDVALTGAWEYILSLIADGESAGDKFSSEIRTFVTNVVAEIRALDVSAIKANIAPDESSSSKVDIACPNCGKPLASFPKGVRCTKECGYIFWRQQRGKELTDGQLKQLIEKGRTGVLSGLVSKEGKRYSAALGLDKDTGKVFPIFDSQGAPEDAILCPKCGKPLTSWPKSVSCTKECGYVMWRNMYGKELSDAHLKQLIEKGRTGVINGFVNRNGRTYPARLVVDPETGRVVPVFDDKK